MKAVGSASSGGPRDMTGVGSAYSGGPAEVEQILFDELTAVQEVVAFHSEPFVAEGFWAPEDLSAQQNQHEMKEDLWFALEEAHRSDAATVAKGRRHGAGRVEGLPIVDPPTVRSRNQLIREDQPFYIAAGFLKLFPLGHGDYWAFHAERKQHGEEVSFMGWLQHLLLRSDGRFQCHPLFYFFALNTALRAKALRSRNYFVKKQGEVNTDAMYTNEELMKMGKAQFTKIIAAFEQAMVGSAQEKLQQRSDLEALVEQIEQETLEQHAEEVLQLWKRTKKVGEDGSVVMSTDVEMSDPVSLKHRLDVAKRVLEDTIGKDSLVEELAEGGSASASPGGAAPTTEVDDKEKVSGFFGGTVASGSAAFERRRRNSL